MALTQLLLPTTFPTGTASQDATAALADTRRELVTTANRVCAETYGRTRKDTAR